MSNLHLLGPLCAEFRWLDETPQTHGWLLIASLNRMIYWPLGLIWISRSLHSSTRPGEEIGGSKKQQRIQLNRNSNGLCIMGESWINMIRRDPLTPHITRAFLSLPLWRMPDREYAINSFLSLTDTMPPHPHPRCDHRWLLLICELDLSLNTLIKQPLIHYGSLCRLFFCVLDFFMAGCKFIIGMQQQRQTTVPAHLCFLLWLYRRELGARPGSATVQRRDQYAVRHGGHHRD